MSKTRYDKKHISMWIDEEQLDRCERHRQELGIKNRSAYIEAALEFFTEHADKNGNKYVDKDILSAMAKIIGELETRMGRQMFKLAVESAKTSKLIMDHCELDIADFDGLHDECVKEVKQLNGAITFPSSMRGKKDGIY